MLVIENETTLDFLLPMQFLESPEWFADTGHESFQVSSIT